LYPALIEGCRPADGWIVVDSTKLTLEATVDRILATVETSGLRT
jgi:cytidylate kinase